MTSTKLQKDMERITKEKLTYRSLIKWYIADTGFRAVILYRISNFLYRKNKYRIAQIVKNYNFKINGCDISPKAFIDEGVFIPHPNGIVIGSECKIGKNVTILQQVTLGISYPGTRQSPVIQSNVYIGSGSKILGNINIGSNCIIGANSVVTKSFKSNLIIAGIPAKEIKEKINEE